MQRTALVFLAGLIVGAAAFWFGAIVTGGFHTYRILYTAGDNFETWIERDRCEPFEVKGLMFGRCPRFR